MTVERVWYCGGNT